MRFCRRKIVFAGVLSIFVFLAGTPAPAQDRKMSHVLLLSIDGLHAVDLAKYIAANPDSSLARLAATGVNFTNATATNPSDSFPGFLAMVTGAGPRVTGVFYDDAYDRSLSPPGSNCATVGTRVTWKQNLDVDPNSQNTTINPANLPLNPAAGCTPVYPHQYLKVNTILK